jgi:lysophospholipase L1-like esterase
MDAIVGYNGRASVTATAADLVALCFDATTCEIWDELGYNDWASAGADWTLAIMTAKLGQLFDSIHSLKPSARIYCQTPIIAGDEAATNGLGDTLAQYRTAKAAAATGRSWVTLVDGTTFVEAGDLVDGIHPGTAGHAKIATAIAGVLGI